MARRKFMTRSEVLELFMADGSDEEDAVDFAEEVEEEDLSSDLLDEEVLVGDLEVDLEDNDANSSRCSTATPTRSTPRPSLSSSSTSPEPMADDENGTDFDVDPDWNIQFEELLDFADEPGMSDWVRNTDNFPMAPPFTGDSGFQIQIPYNATPLFFYQLFVTDQMIKKFKAETNRYAATTCCNVLRTRDVSPRSFFRMWKIVTEGEIMVFLARLIHMGVVQKPLIVDYWSMHPVLSTTFASRHMKRERFRMILSFFHLNDNATYIPANVDGHDPLHKIRPFFDSLVTIFKSVYIPGENICIDEAMCPWRGRVSFRVYMKDKPVKWGIKLYELCESGSGHVWNLEIWCRTPNQSNTPHDVCLRLLEPLHRQGRTLYIDNYYCCPLLVHELIAENTNVVGTVRTNRVGMPKDMNPNLPAGGLDFRRKNQTLAVRWKDKREVNILTTKHLPTMREVRTRTETKQKPTCVVDYTNNMSGVDHSDQMISYLPLHRKTMKWWKKLSFHLLTLVMVQAHCLYNKHHPTMILQKFVLTVALQLIEKAKALVDVEGTTGAAVPSLDNADRLQSRHAHFMEYIGETKKVFRACRVCYAKQQRAGASRTELKNKRKMTSVRCKICKVPLCNVPCMEIYHTVQDYAN